MRTAQRHLLVARIQNKSTSATARKEESCDLVEVLCVQRIPAFQMWRKRHRSLWCKRNIDGVARRAGNRRLDQPSVEVSGERSDADIEGPDT